MEVCVFISAQIEKQRMRIFNTYFAPCLDSVMFWRRNGRVDPGGRIRTTDRCLWIGYR